MPDRSKLPAPGPVAAMLAVLALAAALFELNEWIRRAALERSAPPAASTAPGSGSARVGAPFSLLDTAGRRVASSDFRGRKIFLIFADPKEKERVAPALQVASAAIGSLGSEAASIAPVLVSLDTSPEAPLMLASVLVGLHVAWIGLSGTAEEIAALAGAYYVPLPGPNKAPQLGAPPVGPPIAYLVDAAGAFVAHLPIPNDPDRLAEWLQRKL